MILQIKARLKADYRNWEDIPYWTETRDLSIIEAGVVLGKLKEWCQTDFVAGIRYNEMHSLQGHYFINMNTKNGVNSLLKELNTELSNVELTPN